jgi:cytochrome bd-type quinol oxidase subunit 2
MEDALFTAYSFALVLSILVYLAIGIIFLKKKQYSAKAAKTYGILLMAMGVFNLVLFNIVIFQIKEYRISEFISLILFFLIPFGEGFTLLSAKQMKARKLLGLLLILPALLFIVLAALNV